MNSNDILNKLRLKLLRVLQSVVPEGSELDAIFDSYDDWREMRHAISEERAAKTLEREELIGDSSKPKRPREVTTLRG